MSSRSRQLLNVALQTSNLINNEIQFPLNNNNTSISDIEYTTLTPVPPFDIDI